MSENHVKLFNKVCVIGQTITKHRPFESREAG